MAMHVRETTVLPHTHTCSRAPWKF